MTHDWLKSAHHALHFLKPEYRAKERCSVLSDHLNHNMLTGYYGISTWWHQKQTAYLSFNCIFIFNLQITFLILTAGPFQKRLQSWWDKIWSWKKFNFIFFISEKKQRITEEAFYVYIAKQLISACWKHLSYFCPAVKLQHAVAATELSITQHLEQQSASFAKERGCNSTAQQWTFPHCFHCFWVSNQRVTIPSGTWGYFPVATELQKDLRIFFTTVSF